MSQKQKTIKDQMDLLLDFSEGDLEVCIQEYLDCDKNTFLADGKARELASRFQEITGSPMSTCLMAIETAVMRKAAILWLNVRLVRVTAGKFSSRGILGR